MRKAAVKCVFLSEPDMIEAGVLDMHECVRVMDEVFDLLGKGDYLMGGPRENEHGVMLYFPQEKRFPKMPLAGPDRRFAAMIAYVGGRFNVCGTKWYGSNVENPEVGLPRSILTVILNDPETSAPLAIMSGNLVSAMRTGAVPGVAAKYLATKGARVCGAIGAGVINRACIMSIAETVKTLEEIRIYDLVPDKATAFAKEVASITKTRAIPVRTLEASVVDADVISIAAAGPKRVAIPAEWLKKGTLVTLTGTADLPGSCYLENTVVVDHWKMHQAWMTEVGEHPLGINGLFGSTPSAPILQLILEGKLRDDHIQSLGDIVSKKIPGRKTDEDTIIFVTGGLPVEDVAWGYTVYQNALRKKIGQELKYWDAPHWF